MPSRYRCVDQFKVAGRLGNLHPKPLFVVMALRLRRRGRYGLEGKWTSSSRNHHQHNHAHAYTHNNNNNNNTLIPSTWWLACLVQPKAYLQVSSKLEVLDHHQDLGGCLPCIRYLGQGLRITRAQGPSAPRALPR